MPLGVHVKYALFLSDFNETWILLTEFRKILKYQVCCKTIQWQPQIRSIIKNNPVAEKVSHKGTHDKVDCRFTKICASA
jgi:hypothetical protein